MEASAQQAPDVHFGPEIANAWGWLLARAPRIARALYDTPGASQTFADILAGFDLFHRKYGLHDKQQFAEVHRAVSYNEATDMIIVRQTWLD